MIRKLLFISALLLCQTSSFAANPTYKIKNNYSVEGNGGWDYLAVDTMYNRIFISHSKIVNVLDLTTGLPLKTISGLNGVHGIAFAYQLNKGFISNGKDTTITVFNLKDLSITNTIKVTGLNPDAILFDNFSHKLFVFNGRSSNATVIDGESEKIVATIPLSGKPEAGVSNEKGKVYVNIEDKSELTEINSMSLSIERTWSIAPGEEPSGLAIDAVNKKLFSVCDNKLMVISDITTGKVITTVPIGENTDGAAFDSFEKNIFSSNGDGSLTIIHQDSPEKYSVSQSLTTQKGARTISLNEKTHFLYLSVAEYGETPAPTEEHPHPRPAIKENSFKVIEIGF